ncbi:MAG: PD-(D/E)XK nuclease family protein [bacterium]|nr:PD-(D/E)XK nuclease family protein [bacterium]
MPLSFSQLSLYQRCPKQYEFANIKKLPRSISAGESFGSSMHNALARFGKRELGVGNRETGVGQIALFEDVSDPLLPTPESLTLSLLTEYWHQSFIVQGYDSKKDMEAARSRGEEIITLFYDWWRTTNREVVAIEKGFRLQLSDGPELSGRFDRVEQVEGGLHVIDYKTSAVRPQEEVDVDLQLSVYALACDEVFGQPCVSLSFLFLREDGITDVVTHRTKKALQDDTNQIQTAEEGISQKIFDPTPSRQICMHCPYKNVCSAAVFDPVE